MKKTINILAALMLLFSVSSFASGKEEVSLKVQEAFKKDFSPVTSTNWEKKNDFYFATFMLNEVQTNAAYNEEGELVAVSRSIEMAKLPLSITIALTKKFEDFKLPSTAMEMNFEGQTAYYLTLENDKKILNLKCYSNGEISVENKVKK